MIAIRRWTPIRLGSPVKIGISAFSLLFFTAALTAQIRVPKEMTAAVAARSGGVSGPVGLSSLATSSVALSASPSPSVFGAPVTLTAVVTPAAATGKVTFFDGVDVLGIATLSSGTASLSTIMLPAGVRSLKAYYSGDATYAPGISSATAQTVNAVASNVFSTSPVQAGTAVYSLATGDFNGDGKADLAIGFYGGVKILLGNGDGTFAFSATYTINGYAYAITVGDFNADGRADLAIAASAVNIFLGNGDGTFQAAVSYSTGIVQHAIVAADLNGDGAIDLAVSGLYWGVVIFLGRGDGTFQNPVLNSSAAGDAIAVADFNLDGTPDLAMIGGSNAVLAVMAGNGDGSFRSPTVSYFSQAYSLALAATDFNGDGKPDLVFPSVNNVSCVYALAGNGDGTFGSQQVCGTYSGRGASPLLVADINGNGRPEAVVGNFNGSAAVAVLPFGADGTLQAAGLYLLRASVSALAVADFNGDGKPDLAVGSVSASAPGVTILTGAQASLAATSGTPQSAIAGLAFSTPLQVAVTDSGGHGIPGVPVTFRVAAAGSGAAATLSADVVTTDATGVASVTATSNHSLGSYTVTASVGPLTASFALTNVLGPAANLTATSGSPQYTLAGTAFATPLGALVTDAGGNPLSGVTVTFSAPASGASAALSAASAVTNANGIASITATANGTVGVYAVTAAAGGFSLSFTLGNQDACSASLSVSPNPSRFGSAVTLTATVTPSAATGKITFFDDATPLGVSTLSSGTASLSTKLLPAGRRKLRAIYGGDPTYAIASTSIVSQAVNTIAGNIFASAGNLTVGGSPYWVTLGDFNGDGNADLVTANTNAGLTVLLGNGDGTFQQVSNAASLSNARLPVTGDFDGDGKQDLAVVPYSGNSVIVVLGNGDGTFKDPVSYPLGASPVSVALADFNNDGKIDLAVGNSGAGVSILLGNGDGTFQAAVNFAANTYGSIVAGDFNGDGKSDLALAGSNSPNVSVLLGNGDGTFRAAVTYVAGYSPYGIAAADFNGDGKLDLATANYSANNVTVLLGNGDGTLQPAIAYAFSSNYPYVYPMALSVGDFNGDGNPDLAVATADGLVRILAGAGNGAFSQAGIYTGVSPSSYAYSLAVGDFDGNGKPDLAIPFQNNGKIAVLLGASVELTSSGTPQTAIAGTAFASPLQVTAMDGTRPVAGITVNFTAPSSGGATATLSSATAVTDASGVASVTATANHTPGNYAITAGAGQLLVLFQMTNVLGPPVTLTPANTPQFARTGLAFTKPLQVTVKDAGGNLLSGVTVTFTAPASGASATLSSATAVSDSGGIARVTATANGSVGSYSVTATAGSASATFALTNQAPSSITLGAAPSTVTFGAAVTLTAAISPAAATGKVTFYDGAAVIGIGAVSSGAASVSTILLPAGNRKLRAYYSGDSNYAAGFSNTATEVVNAVSRNVFAAVASPSVSSAPVYVAVGDFNGDGKADLATAGSGNSQVSILLGNADGTFQAARNFATASNPVALAVADFNSDGKQDLAAVNYYGNNVSILLGNGDGTFQTAVNSPSCSSPHSIVVADFDNDGIADIAVGSNSVYAFSVLLGNGDGTFRAPVNYDTPSSPYSIVAGDFNNDGRIDVATADYYAGKVSVLLGAGDGTFQAAVNYSTGASPYAVVAADFNGDGQLDLVTANYYSSGVSVLLGYGDGRFQTAISSALGSGNALPHDFEAGDFNGDGKSDLIAVTSDGVARILIGDGAGSFQQGATYGYSLGPASYSYALAVGEFDGNGRPDVAIVNSGAASVNVLLSAAASFSASGTPQTAIAGTAFAALLQVTAVAGATPVAGIPVLFTAPSSGAAATLSSATVLTNASGVASVTATANTTLGSYTVTAVSGSLSVAFALTNVLGPPASVTAGNATQATGVGTAFGKALQAIVKDAGGNPLQNVTVTFTAPANGATAALSSAAVVTNASGIASVTATANNVLGSYTVTASVGSLTASFSLTNQAASSASLAVSPTAATFGSAVVLTATVTPASATGKVTFWDGVTMIGAASLSSGTASYSTRLLPSGSHKLRAYYVGNSGMAGSRSSVVGATVTAAAATFLKTGTRGTLGSSPSAIAVGDFNSDGKADVAIADSSDNSVRVLLGNGDGTFWTAISFAVGNTPTGIVSADFNCDGATDLAVAYGANSSNGGVSVLLGNGDGTFRPAVNYVTPYIRVLAVADFNGDGIVDFAAVGPYNSTGSILLGNGDGTFQSAISFNAGASARSVAAADFNDDGKADLVTGSDPWNYEVLLGNGDGSFQSPVTYLGGYTAQSLALGDFNGDGKQDFAGPGMATGDVSVMLGNGNGTFQDRIRYRIFYETGWLAPGDFNGDGKIDLAAAGLSLGLAGGSFGSPAVSILNGNGDGSFTPSGYYAGGSLYAPIAVADFDGDGRTDLMVTTTGSPGGFTVLQGASVNITTAGTPQRAVYNTAFGSPLQVVVKDGSTPVSGVIVTFTAPSSGASAGLSATSAATDASGTASVTATANAYAGAYTVVAGVGNTTVTFQLTNWSGSSATYLVGDVYPVTSDVAPNFGDSSLDVRDLVQELFAVTNVPGYRPAACTDRFDAMDAYPADTASTRGGDGTLDIRDLILELFRATALDNTRPTRSSRGGVCGAGLQNIQSNAAPAGPDLALRRLARSDGALELGVPERLSGGEARVPVYLTAARDLARIAVAFSLGDLNSKLRFTPAAGLRPSLVSDTQQGIVAAAWTDGVSASSGERLLLGYIQGPAATAATWRLFGLSASGLDDNREITLSPGTLKQ